MVTPNLYTPSTAIWRTPTVQQTLLLRAALLPNAAALAAWQSWRADADLDQLPPGGFLLLPLVAYNLQRHALVDPILEKCQGIQRRTWTQNQLLGQGLMPLLQALHRAGITPILQADLALALFHYPAAGLRMIDTVDLLTPPTRAPSGPAQEVLTLLAQAGWQPKPIKHRWLRALLSGAAQPQHFRHAQLRDVTLRWQPHMSKGATPIVAEYDPQGQPLLIRDMPVQCISPTHLLFDLCGRGIVNLQWYGTIQWLADAAILLQTAGPAIDWARLVERSRQQAMTQRLAAALDCLAQTVDAPIPPTIVTTLRAQPSRAVERWERQLFAHRPITARKLAALWLDGQRQRW